MMPDAAVNDPHTLVFDRAGDIWFTAQGANYVGHLAITWSSTSRRGRSGSAPTQIPSAAP